MEPEVHNVRCAGGIVLGTAGTIALVRNRKGTNWFFPKGKIEEGESDEDAAVREIKEETGLGSLERIDDLGSYERWGLNADGTPNLSVLKEIHMFLFATNERELAPTGEIEGATWMPFREVGAALEYEKDRVWFASVFDRVKEAIQRD